MINQGERLVSIHAPARGATTGPSLAGTGLMVSIHAPARGATISGGANAQRQFVSIHAPARGATYVLRRIPRVVVSFNPRSREGSDLAFAYDSYNGLSFNPRSREGSDNPAIHPRMNPQWFQSTLPRGERPMFLDLIGGRSKVSIHAPARGATLPRPVVLRTHQRFNPRSREGSDETVTSTEPPSPCFNPRSREGSDCLRRSISKPPLRVSIHAPARGATLYRPLEYPGITVSIHAPARGATSRSWIFRL